MPENNYIRHYSVHIPVRSSTKGGSGETVLEGTLSVPFDSHGIVVFAHGSGSSRLSPRNKSVANSLNEAHQATLLFDLLSAAEEEAEKQTRHLRFDIGLLSARLLEVLAWTNKATGGLDLGIFGASTGAAAALVAAAREPELVKAVVSRGGRADLAGDLLPRVKAPTLFVVGALDDPIIDINQEAARQMRAPARVELVPEAGHLFEEPGALEQVARMASNWFGHFLKPLPKPEENFVPLH